MAFFDFHPLIERWFHDRFSSPTEPQRQGWPHIAAGEHTLIAAPTGSGKTLTAFLAVIDRLLKEALDGRLEDGMRVVYVSPLRALSNDMHRNLSEPLDELNALAAAEFPDVPVAALRAGLRTGDSTSSQRAALVRKPPHILVTTPESLFLLLTAEKGREALKTVDTVIVDEIHALVRDKRGSHLSLSVERLEALCERPLQRIGLSATQKPIDRIAQFLVGSGQQDRGVEDSAVSSDCAIVDVGHSRELDLKIEVPGTELSAVCSTEQWGEINERLIELINSHRSTLIFVNTRRLAERVTHQLTELLGEEHVGSHHGSLSAGIRLKTEQGLKNGTLKAVVATASLELGLDVGFIDLVVQIGSPRAIATFLQRVGRSGHSLGKTPKGRLFALTRDELLECMGLVRAIRHGRLDVIPIPENPIDVLAQQIVAEVACREWKTDELFDLFRRAWPFRNLQRGDFDETVRFLSEGLSERSDRGRVYIHHDQVQRRLRTRPGARIVAASNAGAIPEVAEFRVVAQPEGTVVGTLDEDFALESHAGQIVLLGNTSWRLEGVRGLDVHVSDAGGAAPTIPFWRGEAPGRTIELSEEVSRLREELEQKLKDLSQTAYLSSTADIVGWLVSETSTSEEAARQAVDYVAAQIAAIGIVPTQKRVVFERFFDETGGMQMVVHAPFGSRVTQAWGLAMRKRFCVSFDFELQATADNDGFILSLGPQHSFPLESMFPMLNAENVQKLLEQAILYIPMFQIRWRWNANRALLVPRRDKGKRIPPNLQRFRADDLLTSVFPMLTGCQENVTGPLELPDQILVRQTMDDCLHEALDVDGLVDLMRRVNSGETEFVARDTREPSPFSYELLNSNPYAFLDGGELPERRARAVSTRRSLNIESVSDLGRLDPLAIEHVVSGAQPVVRNADELHDVLLTRIVVPDIEVEDSRGWLEELVAQRRATRVSTSGGVTVWCAAERLPAVQAMFIDAVFDPPIDAPEGVRRDWNEVEARVSAMRGLMETSGPLTAEEAGGHTGMTPDRAFGVLEALEGEGVVLRGRFRERDSEQTEWCHRRLLSRIHRLTMEGLRRQIEPVSADVFLRFLTHHHGLTRNTARAGVNGLFEVVSLLQGFDLPAVAWERDVLPQRVDGYRTGWLDELCLSGEVGWGRLFPPRRDGDTPATLTRVVPVSLFLRSDLVWLATPATEDSEPISPEARQVLEVLAEDGAVFATDLQQRLSISGEELKDALGELVSRGRITADGFGGLRSLLNKRTGTKSLTRRPGLARTRNPAGGTGRWSLWRRPQPPVDSGPGSGSSPRTDSPERSDDGLSSRETVEQWAWQLLRRWGVVFRDLLERESGAPRWWELLQVYRRLEARGEIRGGRFITGVAGEQFALGETVKKLRQLRDKGDADGPAGANGSKTSRLRAGFLQSDEPAAASSGSAAGVARSTGEELVILSAADPLNLIGIVTKHSRVPAVAHNRIALHNGRPVAALVNGEVVFLETVPATKRDDLARALGGPEFGEGQPQPAQPESSNDEHDINSRDDETDSDSDSHSDSGVRTGKRKRFVRPLIS